LLTLSGAPRRGIASDADNLFKSFVRQCAETTRLLGEVLFKTSEAISEKLGFLIPRFLEVGPDHKDSQLAIEESD